MDIGGQGLAGFTFVGRESEVAAFRQMLERPQGETLLVGGAEGTGKSHLLRQLRLEAERAGHHAVVHCCLGHLLDADLRQYAILSCMAAAHEAGAASGGLTLVPSAREFFGHLLGEDHRPVSEKLLGLLAVAAAPLDAASRLVLLLDLGRAQGGHAFPLEFFAHRLPAKVKLVVATAEAPEALAGQPTVTVVPELPPLAEAEVGRLLEFHLPRGTAVAPLVGRARAAFGGNPLLTDLGAKLLAGAADRAAALAALPATAPELCQQFLTHLGDESRRLIECLARVPSGLDAAALRDLLGASEADLGQMLLADDVRSLIVMRRGPRGTDACIFHESLADLFRQEKDDTVALFHRRAAAHFLERLQRDPHDVEALSAHSYHIRLAGDPVQFMQDFPRTLKQKHRLGLLHLLASEYRLLLMWSRAGESPINRPLCMANLARIYQELGQPQEALRYHKEAMEVYQQQKDRSGTAAQLGCIATALCDLGHHDEAIRSLQQAMAINEALNRKAALGSDLASLGTIQERLGRPHDALRSFQKALDLCRELRDDVDAAAQLGHIAAIHRKLGNRREAVARYQEAWRLNNRSGAARAEVDDLLNLGFVFDELDETGKAITCVQQAIELDHALGDRHVEARHLRTLGAMQLKQGEADEATRCLEQAATLSRSFGDPAGEAVALLELAKTHRAAGRIPAARQALEQAAALAARISNGGIAEQVRLALEDLGAAPKAEDAPQPTPPQEAPVESPLDDVRLDEPDAEAEKGTFSFSASSAPLAPPAGGGAEAAALRAQLEETRRELAALKAELAQQKQIAETLKEIMAKAIQKP